MWKTRLALTLATVGLVLGGGCIVERLLNLGARTVNLGTACFVFRTGLETDCTGDFDIVIEPWCQGRVGVCGNWVQTNETNLDAVTTPPASGYISDIAGYEDCQELDTGKVIVFKLSDGTYAKGIFVSETKDANGCVTGVTFQYVYPM